MPNSSLAVEGVEEAISDRLARPREFRSIVFTAPDSDTLASVDEIVVEIARRRGNERILGGSELREKLSRDANWSRDWARLLRSSPRNGLMVLRNPSAAMRG